jgi:translation initiation factor 2 alpha subunit (eIF-2alpha)
MNMKQAQIKYRNGTITAIAANIASGDFDITQQRAQGIRSIKQVLQHLEVMVNLLMKIRRFIPDFISQTGNDTE